MEYIKEDLQTYASSLINKRIKICLEQIELLRLNLATMNRELAELSKWRFTRRSNMKAELGTVQSLLRAFQDQFQFYSELLVDMSNGDACNFVGIMEEEIEKEEVAYSKSFYSRPGSRGCKPEHIQFKLILVAELAAMKELFHTDKKLCPKHSLSGESRDYTVETDLVAQTRGFGRWMDIDEA